MIPIKFAFDPLTTCQNNMATSLLVPPLFSALALQGIARLSPFLLILLCMALTRYEKWANG